MGMFVGVGCLCAALAGLVVLVVGSALLRIAVATANKLIGPVNQDAVIGWDWDEDEDLEPVIPSDGPAIPELGRWLSMLIVFLSSLVNVTVGLGLRYVFTRRCGACPVE
jgi:hypothetical protein